MVIQPGQILNPLGNPNIGQISKQKSTGPRTIIGRYKQLIKSDMIKHGKYLKLPRTCDTCPLQPVIIRDTKLFRCAYYETRHICKLDIFTWKNKLRAFFIAEEMGEEQILKLLAAEAYVHSIEAANTERATKLMPARNTHEFLKTAGDMIEKSVKIKVEQRKLEKSIPENISTFNISELIKKEQLKDGDSFDD